MTLAVLIQARMNSTRFPAKVLAPLADKPVLAHLIDACDRAGLRRAVAVVVPYGRAEDPIIAYCQRLGVRSIQATDQVHPNDVLTRFVLAVNVIGIGLGDTIVRLTADCPLLDHRVLGALVAGFDQRRGYAGQVNAPDGTDVEVFTYDALREANRTAKGPADREHVTTAIQRKYGFIPPKADPACRFSVDTIEDLRRCEQLLATVGPAAEWQKYVEALTPPKVKA